MEVLFQVSTVIWLEYKAFHSILLLIYCNHSYTECIDGIDNSLSDSSGPWFSYITSCTALPVLNKELLNSTTNLFLRALDEGFLHLLRKKNML